MRAWFQVTSVNILFFEAVKKQIPVKIAYHQNAVVGYTCFSSKANFGHPVQ